MGNDRYLTNISLIQRIKDSDDAAWDEFVSIYKGMIINWALAKGCTFAMAEDVYQETIISVFKAIPDFEYNPARGRFRSFLKTILNARVYDAFRRKKLIYENEIISSDERLLEEDMNIADVDEDKIDFIWITSLIVHALKCARKKVSELTYRSFEMYAVHGYRADVVAKKFAVSENTVYQHKNRFLKIIAQEVSRLISEWGETGMTDKLEESELLDCIIQIIAESKVKSTMQFSYTAIRPSSEKKQNLTEWVRKKIMASAEIVPPETKPALLYVCGDNIEWKNIYAENCSIGRLETTIVCRDSMVSAFHALICRKSSYWFVKDQDSTNGTYLNERRLGTAPEILKNGDVIRVAEKHRFIFVN